MFLALVFVRATDPADNLMADMAGVWQTDGASVVIDVAGQTKTITYGGGTRVVRLASHDSGVIVFEDVRHPKTLITLQKLWSQDRASYSRQPSRRRSASRQPAVRQARIAFRRPPTLSAQASGRNACHLGRAGRPAAEAHRTRVGADAKARADPRSM